MLVRRRITGAITAALVGWSGLALAAPAAEGQERGHVGSRLDLPVPVPVTPPELTGVGEVGALLTVIEPVWTLPVVGSEIAWLRDGVLIPGAEGLTYLVSGDDAGSDISAQVTSTLAGITAPVTLVTNALGIPLPDSGGAGTAPQATVPPKIATTPEPKIGNELTATPPTWDTEGVENTYQWLRGNAPIAAATTSKYKLVPDDLGKQISVKVTGTKAGATTTATSAPVTAQIGDAPVASVPPSIAGENEPGGRLTASPGTWTGTPAPTFGYQWYRNGQAIAGATQPEYVVQSSDAGRRIALAVTATRPGHTQGVGVSNELKVAKLPTATQGTLLKKKVAQGSAAAMKVSVTATGVTPAGKVAVYRGKKLLKSYALRPADNGVRTVKLPKLPAGKHKLRAAFTGSKTMAPSLGKTVVLTVTKAGKKK